MSGSKKQSIYIPDHLRPVIDLHAEQPPGLSNRIAAIIDRYGHLTGQCPQFSRAEWCLILDACNGWPSWSEAGEMLMTGVGAEVADHIDLHKAGEKWGLTSEQCRSLVERVAALDAVGVMSLVERIERFWRRSGMETDAALKAAGIEPTN